MQKIPKKRNVQQGFTMIEILVTMVVVATALLGTAGLQAYALKTNVGSQFRNQAIFLSSDIVERMEANKGEAVVGTYTLAAGGAAPVVSTACDTGNCSSAALAAYDLANWQVAIAGILPSGVANIAFTPENLAAVPPVLATYTITISWVDRATNQNSGGAAVANGGKGENFSIVTTKTIRNQI